MAASLRKGMYSTHNILRHFGEKRKNQGPAGDVLKTQTALQSRGLPNHAWQALSASYTWQENDDKGGGTKTTSLHFITRYLSLSLSLPTRLDGRDVHSTGTFAPTAVVSVGEVDEGHGTPCLHSLILTQPLPARDKRDTRVSGRCNSSPAPSPLLPVLLPPVYFCVFSKAVSCGSAEAGAVCTCKKNASGFPTHGAFPLPYWSNQ